MTVSLLSKLEPYAGLPIFSLLPSINAELDKHDLVLLQAAPGAGKTSLVPLSLLTADFMQAQPANKIMVLEPRRMAARAAATRMASILGEPLGQTVGYRMRSEAKVSGATRIEVVTEGIMLRMLQEDPSLEGVAAIIFDECHERSLNSDLSLALTLQVNQLFRDAPIKLLVMSATLEGLSDKSIFADAPLLESEGRQYPVDIVYSASINSFEDIVAKVYAVLVQALAKHGGSILVFMPGQREIHRLIDKVLEDKLLESNTCILPLYGALPLDKQLAAIQPLNKQSTFTRKVVVATDIAETSLTIDGITVVIDCGLCKVSRFDGKSASSRLHTQRISQASSIQRAGRAGRLQAGTCYRLWGEQTQASLAKHAEPEIFEAELSPLLLQLKSFGLDSADELVWIDPPRQTAMKLAEQLLQKLQVLDATGQLTAHGEVLSHLAVHPRLAHLLVEANTLHMHSHKLDAVVCDSEHSLLDIALALIALFSERDPLQHFGGDIDKKIAVLLGDMPCDKRQRAWLNRSQSLMKSLRASLRAKDELGHTESLSSLDLLQAGFSLNQWAAYFTSLAYPERIALRLGEAGAMRYKTAQGQTVSLREDDRALAGEVLCIAELGGAAGKEAMVFSALALSKQDLLAFYQRQLKVEARLYWDERAGRFVAQEQTVLFGLCLATRPLQNISMEQKNNALFEVLQSKGIKLINWSEKALSLQQRVALLHRLMPQSWPDFSDTALLVNAREQIHFALAEAAEHIQSVKDFKKIDAYSLLKQSLNWELVRELDDLAPEAIQVPSGSNIRIDYSQSPPVLAVKLQEMFGCTQTPTIAQGKQALLIHLLSPAKKPLQVTQDLAAFWQGSYHEVKKEMKGRYPKHPWPDDPLKFEATRLTKKRLQEKQ